jgi:homeobox protein cut-like
MAEYALPLSVPSNSLALSTHVWSGVDLSSLISTLDTAASDLVTHQRDTLVQRKELAQKTKDFRKLEDAAKLGEIKALLKSYQSFIDLISNQSKSTQSAFLQIYSPLSEAPDPYPLLEASIDSFVIAQEVVPKLESENKHLQSTVTKLTVQLEEAESQLEKERSTRQSSQSSQDTKIKEVEASWKAVLKEKQDNWEAREKSLEEKVDNQDRLLKELKASYDVAQRLGKAEDDTSNTLHSASQQELDLVNQELEKANLRLSELEGRNEQLRLDLVQSTTNSNSSQTAVSVEDDPSFLRLRSENSQLLRKLDAQRYEKDSDKTKWDSNVRSLERELESLKQDRESIKRKLDKCSDYDEVKQELDMLKSIEFATGDGDDSDHETETAPTTDKGESLEKLLLARNKKLSNELTILRVSHNDLQSRLETLQEDLSSTNMELEKSRNLTQTLEEDLLQAQNEASNAFDPSAMSVAGTYTSRYPKSSYAASIRRGANTSPTSSIISGFDTGTSSPRGLDSLRSEAPNAGILPMVTAQRDRFKAKIRELETNLQEQYTLVSSLRSEIASLQKDNLSLYEKSRYVNSYNTKGGATSGYSSTNPSTITIDRGNAGTDARYKSAYENSISPFAAFRSKETSRAFQRLSLPERAVLQASRLVLATRTSRNMFAIWVVGLHLLVFVMLFWMGGSSDTPHLAHTVAAGNAAIAGAKVAAAAQGGSGGSGAKWEQPGFGDT